MTERERERKEESERERNKKEEERNGLEKEERRGLECSMDRLEYPFVSQSEDRRSECGDTETAG